MFVNQKIKKCQPNLIYMPTCMDYIHLRCIVLPPYPSLSPRNMTCILICISFIGIFKNLLRAFKAKYQAKLILIIQGFKAKILIILVFVHIFLSISLTQRNSHFQTWQPSQFVQHVVYHSNHYKAQLQYCASADTHNIIFIEKVS